MYGQFQCSSLLIFDNKLPQERIYSLDYLYVQSSQVQIDRAATIFRSLAHRVRQHMNRKQIILAVMDHFVRTAAGEINVTAIKGFYM